MYSEEQRIKALRMYHRIGSVTDTVRRLGYPSREQLHAWIRNDGKPKERRKKLNLKTLPNILETLRRSLRWKRFVVVLRTEKV